MTEPKNQLLTLAKHLSIPEALTRATVTPFLNEKTLYALTWTCKSYRNQYKDKHADKKVAAEMLNCVLNPNMPNQIRFLELLSRIKQDKIGQPLYLINNHGEEIYFNKAGLRKTKTIRYCTNVLEAILRTKNFHLAKTLFNCIPEQEKTEHLKKYISVINSQEMWGMPELQRAYNNFLIPWQASYDDQQKHELDKLSGRIGQALKDHLPWFSIYLFCHPVTHANADYRQAPHWACMLWNDLEFDLDLFGQDSIYALYKGRWECYSVVTRLSGRASDMQIDLQAFSSQSKVLSSEMDTTIEQFGLDQPELDASKKP